MLLPKSRLIKVEFMLALPCEATKMEVMEWVRDVLGDGGGIAAYNALGEHDIECWGEPTLTDTELHLHERIEPIAQVPGPPGTRGWKTERWADKEPYTGPSAMEQLNAALKANE